MGGCGCNRRRTQALGPCLNAPQGDDVGKDEEGRLSLDAALVLDAHERQVDLSAAKDAKRASTRQARAIDNVTVRHSKGAASIAHRTSALRSKADKAH
eukprot:3294494-Pleurochrysis_carterae.AAC.4